MPRVVTDTLIVIGDDPTGIDPARQEKLLACDTETTGLEWEDRMLGVSLAWIDNSGTERSCYLVDVNGTKQLPLFQPIDRTLPTAELNRLLMTNTVAMQNHSFDYRVLMHYAGTPPIPNIVDTLHLARQLDANKHDLLSSYVQHVGPVTAQYAAIKEQRGSLAKHSVEVVAEYARDDAKHTLRLAMALRKHKWPKHKWDNQLTHLTMQMVDRGLPVDFEWAKQRSIEWPERFMALQIELARKGIANVNNHEDVLGYFRSKGMTLNDSTEEELAKAKSVWSDPDLDRVIEARQLAKGLSSWIGPITKNAAWDGKLHSIVNPFGTRSFRMSSSDPNAQGIPMEYRDRAYGSMMGLFKSDRPGQALYALDLKQAEVRLAAILSGDTVLQRSLVGSDPYVTLALSMWNDAKRRKDAKQAMLSSIYEVGAKTYAMRYGVPEADAKEILGTFRKRFSKMRACSKQWEAFVTHYSYVPLITGRPRWFSAEEVEKTSYKAFNQRVQGTVAEVMHEFCLRFEAKLPGAQVLQVHDSTVAHLETDPVRRAAQLALADEALTRTCEEMLPKDCTVPMVLDVKPWQTVMSEE